MAKPKAPKVDWKEAIKPLIKKYQNKKHPLDANNVYEMLVAVVLSAQSTDDLINQITPKLFEAFPDMVALSKAEPEMLWPYIIKVRGSKKKAEWIVRIAGEVKSDKNIPLTIEGMVKLPGIGRKSANVIMRYAKVPAEGVIVDIHVLRVAPRLGITKNETAEKIEEDIMNTLPQSQWDAGMAMSFLGREICRPDPLCPECLMKPVCEYYNKVVKMGKHPYKPPRGSKSKVPAIRPLKGE
jgi:endonuclease-3